MILKMNFKIEIEIEIEPYSRQTMKFYIMPVVEGKSTTTLITTTSIVV